MRKDYYRDLWTYVAPGRGERKFEVNTNVKKKKDKNCFFCPGNEDQTPPELSRVTRSSGWQIRVFENKFPITGGYDLPDNVWETGNSYGRHEIIVETPKHSEGLAEISDKGLVKLLETYRERIVDMEKDEGISYVQVFKNYGSALAGASLAHSHSQLVGVNEVPPKVQERVKHSKLGHCAYCWMLGVERESARVIFENDSMVAFVPFAPQYEYEAWILSKKHQPSLAGMEEESLTDLAQALKFLIGKSGGLAEGYNFMIYYGPKGDDFHFHIEFVPRIEHTTKAGFELGTGYAVMTTTPEKMAQFYRGDQS